MNGDCLRSLGDVALAGGAFMLGGVLGVKFAEGVLDLVGAGKDFALDLSDAQKQPLDEIRKRVEASINASYKTWLKDSRSAGRNEADVEAALKALPEAIRFAKPSIADLNLDDAGFARQLLARLPPDSPCASTETGRTVFERLLKGVRTVAQLDAALQPHFALVRWEATLAEFDRAQADRDAKHKATLAAIGTSQEGIDRIERLLQQLTAKGSRPAKQTRAGKSVSIEKLRPIFLATQRELPKATDADLVRHVEAAVEDLLKRAEQKPQAFNDSREINDAIAKARRELAGADTEGALETLDGAYIKEFEDIGDLEQLVAARKRGAARLKVEQAEILKIAYRWDEAIAAFEAAARLAPDEPWHWFDIGDIHLLRGDLLAARTAFQSGEETARRIGDDRELSVGFNRTGDVLVAIGDLPKARQAFEDGLVIALRLAKSNPADRGWQHDVSISYEKLGGVLEAQDDLPGARTAFEQSLAIRRRLVDSDPRRDLWQRELAVTYNRIGDMLMAENKLPEARKLFEQSLAVVQRLARGSPRNARWQRDLYVGNCKIGDVLFALRDLDAAQEAYATGLRTCSDMAQRDPSNVAWKRDMVEFHEKLALAGADPAGNLASALGIANDLNDSGRLAPRDAWIVADLKARLAALGPARP